VCPAVPARYSARRWTRKNQPFPIGRWLHAFAFQVGHELHQRDGQGMYEHSFSVHSFSPPYRILVSVRVRRGLLGRAGLAECRLAPLLALHAIRVVGSSGLEAARPAGFGRVPPRSPVGSSRDPRAGFERARGGSAGRVWPSAASLPCWLFTRSARWVRAGSRRLGRPGLAQCRLAPLLALHAIRVVGC
jgi:hypothetical protein